MTERHVCVVTGSRAEFDLLRWLMGDIRASSSLRLSVVATGMHLAPEFGFTVTQMQEAGFPPDDIVESLLCNDTPSAVAKSIGLGVIGFADVFRRLAPDVVVVLGDRFEIFAAAQAALVTRRVIAHIHGGESTEGALDEAIRHGITKMAHVHFVSTEVYRRRVIQLGEQPDRVFNVGALGLDRLHRVGLSRDLAIEGLADLGDEGPLIVMTHHPPTAADTDPLVELEEILTALQAVPARIVVTLANADAAGRSMNARVRRFHSENPERVAVFESLGQERYLALLAAADAVVGNSSSGIIEAPSVRTPTVNVGPRQRGRVRGESVIDCAAEWAAIRAAIARALDPGFAAQAFAEPSPYDQGGASERIRAVLESMPVQGVVMKRFYDIPAP